MESIINEYSDLVIETMGLDSLEIDDKIKQEIAKDVLNMIITSTSYKPSPDVIVKRIQRHIKDLYKIVAYRILESGLKPTPQQLDFIVSYGEEVLVPHISELYKLAKEYGKDYVVSMLQYVWEKHGKPSPIECPKCGFRAIMPDFSCLICGYVVTEDYIREKLNFEEKFKEYVAMASVAELKEVLDLGYVLVSEIDIKSPKERIDMTSKIYYPIYLRSRETSLIIEEINSRKLPI